MTLITEAIMLVKWEVTLVTRSYMHKNGGKVPGQGAVGTSWRQGGLDVRSVGIYFMASLSCL